MLSFTYGDKLKPQEKSSSETTENDLTGEATTSNATPKNDETLASNVEYDIKGKDWFFIPDYAGEAASAVKLQILQIIDLV